MTSPNDWVVEMLTGNELYIPSDVRLDIVLIDENGVEAGPFKMEHKLALLEVRFGGKDEVHHISTSAISSRVAAIRLISGAGFSLGKTNLTQLFIRYVRIRNAHYGLSSFCPIYSWMSKGQNRIFFAGKATLPSEISPGLLRLRAEDQAYWQSLYPGDKLVRLPGVPVALASNYDDLPMEERFLKSKFLKTLFNVVSNAAEVNMTKFIENFDSWSNWEEMDEMLYDTEGSGFSRPACAIDWLWAEDEHFGRSLVDSVNPAVIQLCQSLPVPDTNITAEILTERVKLLQSKDIDKELSLGKFVCLDLRPLLQQFVDKQEEKRQQSGSLDEGHLSDAYMAPAVCLLYFDEQINTIVPVAIQLKKEGDVYTPPAPAADITCRNRWLLAKMFASSASCQVHQLVTHLCKTHLAAEAFAIATRRTLSPAHPIFRLLKPHLRYTCAINALARQRLLGTIQKLFSIGEFALPLAAAAYEKWTFQDGSPIVQLEKNGFGFNAQTPLVSQEGAYPWREDSLLLWKAICDYVRDYVNIYYHNKDELVFNDLELRRWCLDVSEMHPGKDFPTIVSQDQLVESLSIIIWTASVGHASVNFNQFSAYGYPPNMPARLRMPIPEEISGEITESVLLEALPNRSQSIQSMALSNSLSQYADHEVYLGETGENLHHDDNQAQIVLAKFRLALDEITQIINERNATTRKDHPYVWCLPRKISTTIAV